MKIESESPTRGTSYLNRPEGRIGYDVGGVGPLIVLVPGMETCEPPIDSWLPNYAPLATVSLALICAVTAIVTPTSRRTATSKRRATSLRSLRNSAVCDRRGKFHGCRSGGVGGGGAPRTGQRSDPRRSIRTQRRNDRDAKTAPAYRNGPTLGGAVMERLFAKALQRNASR